MINKLNNLIFPILVNVAAVLLVFIPLDILYSPYKIPLLLLVIFCCFSLYVLFKTEKGRIWFLIIPFLVTILLFLSLAEQYLSFGLMGRHVFR